MNVHIYVKLRNDGAHLTHEFLIEKYEVTKDYYILYNATSMFSNVKYDMIKYSRKTWRTI